MTEDQRIVVVSVINDVVTDQRVLKVARTLAKLGFHVILIGRRLPHSSTPADFPFRLIRFRLPFRKGVLFYFTFQIVLFFRLLFIKCHILHANDLDTLLPNYLVSRIRSKPLVYDTHELFPYVPELQHRPFKRNVWLTLEKILFPRLKYVMTVNDSIARFYEKQYGLPLVTVRNVPEIEVIEHRTRASFGLPQDGKMVIMQGSGINIDRGAEELLLSMKYLPEEVFLVFAGGGDVFEKLMMMTEQEQLQDRVFFFRRMPYETLMSLTSLADCGATLDKPTNLNYLYSLPNKLFDYIRAGIPVIASQVPEVAKIVMEYQIGLVVQHHNPEDIADTIQKILYEFSSEYWREGITKAADEFTWSKESEKIRKIYEELSTM